MRPELAANPMQSRLSPIRETFKFAKDHPDIANLCIGDPSFPPPPAVVAATRRALAEGQTHYENDAGRPSLRQLLAAHECGLRSASFDPYENLVVTNGGTNGIYSVSRAVLDPGDEVLLPEPIWIPFIEITRLLNCTPVFVPTRFEARFVPDRDVLESLVTPRTKLLIVVSPGNPTGAIYREEDIAWLVEFCEKRDIWMLHDEAYRDIVFGGRSQASRVGHSDNVIGVRTLSKSHAMTGFRVGWVVSSNQELIERVRLNVAYNVMCAATPVQIGAEAALSDAPNYMAETLDRYHSRMEYAAKRLGGMGFEVHPPEGSFYLFPRHHYGDGDLAPRLISEAALAVVDGRHFGPSGVRHFRVSCAGADGVLEEGLDRLERWVTDHPAPQM